MPRLRAVEQELQVLRASIAAQVRRLRLEREWTQDEMAERLGADLRWIQRIESGTHNLTLETLTRIARVFRLEVEVTLRESRRG